MTPQNAKYLQTLRNQREKFLNVPAPNPEEMYRLAQNSITSSLSPEEIKNAQSIVDNKVFNPGSEGKLITRPSLSQDWINPPENVIKSIPSEGNREVQFRHFPGTEEYEIAATDILPVRETAEERKFRELHFPEEPPRIPARQDISNLQIAPDGKVIMVSSTHRGAMEGATDRLLMESLKHGKSPHSDLLLPAGRKLVARKALELQNTPKEDMLNKFSKFLNTGKTGKLWSTVAPYIGPAGTALTAGAILASPNPAEAAMMEGVETLVPGGVSDLGVSDERSIPDPRYQEYIRRMSQRNK
jgi:hypothetical protein